MSDLTRNEMAKVHARYMAGGRLMERKQQPTNSHEVFYRFEFPERPGSLRDFLTTLTPRWNVTLFHYRMHGTADVGRVLVGLQVRTYSACRGWAEAGALVVEGGSGVVVLPRVCVDILNAHSHWVVIESS